MRKFINESILSRGSCNFLRSTDGEKVSEGKEKVLRVVVFYTQQKSAAASEESSSACRAPF